MININTFAQDNMFQELTADMRENTAQIHEQMANCLRLEKPFIVCRHEMKSACVKLLGEGPCKMDEKCSNQTEQSNRIRFKNSLSNEATVDDNYTPEKNLKKHFPLKQSGQRLLK